MKDARGAQKKSEIPMWGKEFDRFGYLLYNLTVAKHMVGVGRYEYLPQYVELLDALYLEIAPYVGDKKLKVYDQKKGKKKKVKNIEVVLELEKMLVECKEEIAQVFNNTQDGYGVDLRGHSSLLVKLRNIHRVLLYEKQDAGLGVPATVVGKEHAYRDMFASAVSP